MKIFEVDSQTTLEHILKELKQTEEDGLELSFVKGEATVLDNPLNREIVQKTAEKLKKEITLPVEEMEQAAEVSESTDTEEDNLGFLQDEDVVAKAPIEEVHKTMQPGNLPETKPVNLSKRNWLSALKKLKNKKVIGIGAAGLVLLIIIFGVLFLPSATVVLTLNSQTKETQMNLIADPNAASVDLNKNIIPTQTQTVSKDGQDSANATGQKTIGVSAKGRVTITNQDTTSSKTFLAASTTLTPTATSSATFKLNRDVTIPAAPFGDVSQYGVNVTANQVGPGGNLPAGTLFKINGQNNLVFAKNDTAFSGGSNQQVTVVSSSDRENLKNKLLNDLSQAATDDLQSKVKNSIVPDGSLQTNVTKEVYQPSGVDAQADKVTLSLTVEATANLISKDDLTQILSATLVKNNGNFTVSQKNLAVSAQVVDKNSDGTINLIGKIKANLTPDINKSEIKNKIKGDSLASVKNYLDSRSEINSYQVRIKPSFFSFFNFMPFMSSRISVEVIN